jgi:hypothetical protein
MTDIAIRVENLSKMYRIGKAQKRHDTLRDAISDFRFQISDWVRFNRKSKIENSIIPFGRYAGSSLEDRATVDSRLGTGYAPA